MRCMSTNTNSDGTENSSEKNDPANQGRAFLGE
jgi:hypothetical protein